MNNSLFLHSAMEDPYSFFEDRLWESPAHYDKDRSCWTLYSYKGCTAALTHPAALIPDLPLAGLSEEILSIRRRLVRLCNPPQHALARQMTATLFQNLQEVDLLPLLTPLLPSGSPPTTFDWVDKVCHYLPARYILKGFGFEEADANHILALLPLLQKIMSPSVDSSQAVSLQRALRDIEERIQQTIGPTDSSGLLSLLIQSHDATRGLLSNALLYLLQPPQPILPSQRDSSFYLQYTMEVLRYYPPVHHTRRIAGEDLVIGPATIRKGETIIVMLAAANRDPGTFSHPEKFDIHRPNNPDGLTFGKGPHACLAAAFSLQLTVVTLKAIMHFYNKITLPQQVISYEPLANVRLPSGVLLKVEK